MRSQQHLRLSPDVPRYQRMQDFNINSNISHKIPLSVNQQLSNLCLYISSKESDRIDKGIVDTNILILSFHFFGFCP